MNITILSKTIEFSAARLGTAYYNVRPWGELSGYPKVLISPCVNGQTDHYISIPEGLTVALACEQARNELLTAMIDLGMAHQCATCDKFIIESISKICDTCKKQEKPAKQAA